MLYLYWFSFTMLYGSYILQGSQLLGHGPAVLHGTPDIRPHKWVEPHPHMHGMQAASDTMASLVLRKTSMELGPWLTKGWGWCFINKYIFRIFLACTGIFCSFSFEMIIIQWIINHLGRLLFLLIGNYVLGIWGARRWDMPSEEAKENSKISSSGLLCWGLP